MKRSLVAFGILSGLSYGLASGAPALAQSLDGENAAPRSDTLNDLASDNVEFAADRLTYDSRNNLLIVEGNVVLSQGPRTIYADSVTYNQLTGVVHATGNIRFTDDQGNVLFAEELDIKDDLKNGFINNVKALLSDDTRIAAREGRHENGDTTIFKRAVYSPCDVCGLAEGEAPLWQIKAVKVVHDGKKRRITYRHAYLELFGVPIAYTPYISHPDPTVHAASGFLAPNIGRTSELGAILRAPYYISISRDKDLTIEPVITSAEGPVLFGEYRQNVGFGQFDANGSVTYVDQRDDLGLKTGDEVFRGHFFTRGRFKLDDFANLGGDWQWRYDAQAVSDDTYLKRYNISETDTLTSDLVLERFKDRSYGALSTYHFRGLRVEDKAGLTPIVLPMLEYHYIGAPGFFGSKVTMDANALAITRTDGMDTRRISLQGAWQVPFITSAGDVLNFKASLRGDAYDVEDSSNPDSAANAGENGFTGRVMPQLKFDWRRPMVKYGKTTHQIIEPLVTIVASPDGGNPDEIPNEDSRSFELDDLNIFAANRFTGLDRWDGGSRVAYGMRYGIYGRETQARITIAQSYQLDKNDVFGEASGLTGNWSDYVLALNVTFSPYFDYIHKLRLDKDSFTVRRNELVTTFGPKSFKLSVGYLDINRNLDDPNEDSNDLEDRREVRTSARYDINENWSTYSSYTRNLKDGGKSIYADAGVLYQNECVQFKVTFRKRFIRDRDIEPSTSINFGFVLKHLG